MRRTTVEVTVSHIRRRHPVLALIALVFGVLCMGYGGLIWMVAFGILMTIALCSYPRR